MVTASQINPYTGILVIDNNAQEAFLAQKDAAGNIVQILLMLDTAPTGGFDPAQVTAAWQYFTTKPSVKPGDTITIYGFWNYPHESTRPVMHVVRG